MTLNWDILPNEGIGPVRFGMTPAEVVASHPRIGRPEKTHQEFDGSTMEFRGLNSPRLSYMDGRVRDIDTDFSVPDVRLGDMDIYSSEPRSVMQRLFEMNGHEALIGLGSVFFPHICINTGGFYDERRRRFAIPDAVDEDDTRGLAVLPDTAREMMSEGMRPVRWADLLG